MRRYMGFDIPTVDDIDNPRFRRLGEDTISCINDDGTSILICDTFEINELSNDEINDYLYRESISLINGLSNINKRRIETI